MAIGRGFAAWTLTAMAVAVAVQCSGAAAADPAERESVTLAPTRAVLVLIPGTAARQAMSEHRPRAVDPTSPAEAALVRDCANGESQGPQASRGFLWSFATQAWRVALHPVAVAVHEELLKYARVSDATASADYYRGGDLTGSTAPLNSRISCLRFTRFAGAESDSDEVAVDFVASVQLDAAHDAILLRPLRLYIGQGGAKSVDGHYAVAVSVRADAVWREEFSGHHAQIFEQTLLTQSVDLKPGAYLKYYATDPAASGTRVPIIPTSFGADRTRDFGRAEFGVRVAELGTPPETLKLLAEMLPDPNEKVGQLLIAAAAAGAGAK
jgi:hypothetical protein